MTNIVELLTSFLEQVTPSKDLKPEQWSSLISTVKSTLNESKDHISNSPDPFVEGFFTILNSFVSNKYGSPEKTPDGRNSLSRLASVVSQSSANSSSSSDGSESSVSSISSFGFLENLREYRNLGIGAKSSKDSTKKKGYSALFETLKKVFSKERMKKRKREEKPGQWTGVSEQLEEPSPVEKSPTKRQRRRRGRQKEEQESVREPYSFRSGVSKGGRPSSRSQSSSKRELKERSESQTFETSRESPGQTLRESPGESLKDSLKGSLKETSRESISHSLREEESEGVPPLDLRSLQPHEHVTTAESSVVSRVQGLESVSREEGSKGVNKTQSKENKDLKEKKDSKASKEKSASVPVAGKASKEQDFKVQFESGRITPQNSPTDGDPLESPSVTLIEREQKEKEKDKEKGDDKEKEKDTKPKQTTLQAPEPIYKPLQSLVESKQRVDMYVVAVEMIRTVVTTIDTTREMFNYRAIDPSVFQTNNGTEYSVQIMFSDPKKQYHVSFGDVLRLKRADTFLVTDKYGKRYINIIMSLKNKPSMRLWNSGEKRDLETGRLFIDFNKPTESNRESVGDNYGLSSNWEPETDYNSMDSNNNNNNNNTNNNNNNNNSNDNNNDKSNKGGKEFTWSQNGSDTARDNASNGLSNPDRDGKGVCQFEREPKNELERTKETLKNEAVVLYYDSNVTVTDLDAYIINFLRNWSKKLDPLEVLSNSGFLRGLSDASDTPYDFIVKVLKVCPDYTFLVADATSKALVTNLSPMLTTNLFESSNPIQKGDWIKLRSFVRVFNESNRFLKLSASRFSCVTRIPNIDKKVIGEDDSEGFQKVLVRERRVNLDTWTRTSCLNDSFPKRFKRSKYFIQKLLSTQPTVTFQKASPVHVSQEKEEGEISQ